MDRKVGALTTVEECEVYDGEAHEQIVGQLRDLAVPNLEVADLLEVLGLPCKTVLQ